MKTATQARRERPVLFSSPMIRQLLAGKKTQTRRLVKFPDGVTDPACHNVWWCSGTHWQDGDVKLRCPFEVGMRLWVKETWRPRSNACAHNEDDGSVTIKYAADGADRYVDEYEGDSEIIPGDWTLPRAAKRGNVSPLFMPRWASRITLEVTEVRCERLNQITEADAIAEGASCPPSIASDRYWPTYRDGFRSLWESIHGQNSWGRNQWVWVVSFKVLP